MTIISLYDMCPTIHNGVRYDVDTVKRRDGFHYGCVSWKENGMAIKQTCANGWDDETDAMADAIADRAEIIQRKG